MGAVKFDSRSAPLADASNTTDAANAYPLPGPNGGKLIDFSITLSSAQGPVLFGLFIFRGGSNVDVASIESGEWLRSTTLGATPDIYVLEREVHYPGASTLKIFVRNDSGAAIDWFARWASEIA